MSGFSIPLDRLAAKYNAKLDTVVRTVTLQLFTAVTTKSPVDKGRFKANWNVSSNVPNYTITDSTNTERADAEVQKVLGIPVGGVTFLSNGLPYARRLEYGYSPKAATGMVRISVREFKTFVDRAIR